MLVGNYDNVFFLTLFTRSLCTRFIVMLKCFKVLNGDHQHNIVLNKLDTFCIYFLFDEIKVLTKIYFF